MPTTSSILLMMGIFALSLYGQVVPSQANVDAQAQRRLQEDARESMRRQRVDENIRRLIPALDPSNLSGPNGPAYTRKALATLAELQEDGVAPKDALQRAARNSPLKSENTQNTSSYLLACWQRVKNQLTPEALSALRQGLEPRGPLSLPPFQP